MAVSTNCSFFCSLTNFWILFRVQWRFRERRCLCFQRSVLNGRTLEVEGRGWNEWFLIKASLHQAAPVNLLILWLPAPYRKAPASLIVLLPALRFPSLLGCPNVRNWSAAGVISFFFFPFTFYWNLDQMWLKRVVVSHLKVSRLEPRHVRAVIYTCADLWSVSVFFFFFNFFLPSHRKRLHPIVWMKWAPGQRPIRGLGLPTLESKVHCPVPYTHAHKRTNTSFGILLPSLPSVTHSFFSFTSLINPACSPFHPSGSCKYTQKLNHTHMKTSSNSPGICRPGIGRHRHHASRSFIWSLFLDVYQSHQVTKLLVFFLVQFSHANLSFLEHYFTTGVGGGEDPKRKG